MRKMLLVLLVSLMALTLMSLAAGPSAALNMRAIPQCANGVDDDGDGLVDHGEDPGCSDRRDNVEDDRTGTSS